ncbi:DUF6059 family protein [Peterkaempfera bronchialis]|uniref:DUF6059 family protein n=1 Tax=Peterkaempfera bronchialis TaxID=2126346 RepID=UPI000DADB62A|nr:DUF6059 family protein [Peterkaempfera bronchialis]
MLHHILLPMRWYAAGWGVPIPPFDGTEQPDPQTPAPSGPPVGHPERLVPGVPPTPVERDLWERLAWLT